MIAFERTKFGIWMFFGFNWNIIHGTSITLIIISILKVIFQSTYRR